MSTLWTIRESLKLQMGNIEAIINLGASNEIFIWIIDWDPKKNYIELLKLWLFIF